jgi:hypothetical protein
MHWPITPLLALALVLSPSLGRAQGPADTLADRVVERAYDALNRCDRATYYAQFAPAWYHSVLEDSLAPAKRRTREEALADKDPHSWWASCGDKPRPPSSDPLKTLRRIALGPYVIDEQSVKGGAYVHIDMFEVRRGKIVHEWESDNYRGWNRLPTGPKSTPC